ncbi:hypothetical protein HPP92_021912 [Vanilla planifolia]|uniref:Uncharacterized protein n=1 Tax=Vanilla planifolia TaxID=51239 RepID=A0A835UDC1_VANPL|nr:hypothetical protein HPP92_021912 [Vanilla planifolia]
MRSDPRRFYLDQTHSTMESAGEEGRKPLARIFCCAGALILLSSTGGGILAWWFLSFHQAKKHLWMLPLGLIVLVAPLLACLSISFPDDALRGMFLLRPAQVPAQPMRTLPLQAIS